MDPERWKRLRALMEPALGRPPAERARYLDDACAGDVSLRQELDSLLGAHEEAGSFIEQPAFDLRGTEAAPLTPGMPLGRFVVLERVGSGGMGSVYAAYDSQLDRRVALKLLHAGTDERLRREAQALARLSHPNVITVYDVGADGGRVFIAMEFVSGGTLKDWLRQERRSWRDVLGVFQRAGRGLEAAHAAGLVHRDFKPANVLVGGDKVVVADFGLASAPREDEGTPAGAVLGTPAYMAPEQHAGGAASTAADQFSFCVALDEALRGADAPAWLHHVVLRGLAREPSARFPSMAALLSALSQDPRLDFRRRAALVGVAALLVGLVALVQWTSRRETALCAGAERHLAGVWDETRRSEIDNAFQASGAPFANDARTRVRSLLGTYARDWVRQRTDACEATHRAASSRRSCSTGAWRASTRACTSWARWPAAWRRRTARGSKAR